MILDFPDEGYSFGNSQANYEMIDGKNASENNLYQISLFYHQWDLASIATTSNYLRNLNASRRYNHHDHNVYCGFKTVEMEGLGCSLEDKQV